MSEAPRRISRSDRKLPGRSHTMTEDRPGRMRAPPTRSQSAMPAEPASAGRRVLKRSNTDGGGVKATIYRKKKKGIRVAITVKRRPAGEEEAEEDADPPKVNNNDDNVQLLYQMEVRCSGKFHQKVGWPDVDAFWAEQKHVDKDIMCDLLEDYSIRNYPERVGADNVRPKWCYLQDCRLRGISYYKDFGWDPVELNLKGRTDSQDAVEILESWTRQVKLEDIPYTGTEDIHQVLLEQGDKAVTSTLSKSNLQGHPLALSMMTSETQIVVEFRGLESVVGVLGNDDDTFAQQIDPDTGHQIWRDVKTLRTLLYDKPLPVKEGKGSQRILEVTALETFIKARIHYKAFFEGDVVSDHGIGLLLGERWWAHPLKDIMNGFNIDNAAMIYEDIELRFFSEIGYKMDNEYFDWENHGGKWVKVKKNRVP